MPPGPAQCWGGYVGLNVGRSLPHVVAVGDLIARQKPPCLFQPCFSAPPHASIRANLHPLISSEVLNTQPVTMSLGAGACLAYRMESLRNMLSPAHDSGLPLG